MRSISTELRNSVQPVSGVPIGTLFLRVTLSGHAGKPEAELVVDVQLASRAVSRRFECADERPKVRVEALRVRRRRLGGDAFRVLESSRPRELTVQVAPGVGFGA